MVKIGLNPLTVKFFTELLTDDQNDQILICAGPKNPKDKVYDQKNKMVICSGPILAFTLLKNKIKVYKKIILP